MNNSYMMPKDEEPALLQLVGNRIARIRKARGLDSQQDLATKAGVSLSTISRVENGHQDASLTTLAAIAQALDVSVERLVSVDPAISLLPAEDLAETNVGLAGLVREVRALRSRVQALEDERHGQEQAAR